MKIWIGIAVLAVWAGAWPAVALAAFGFGLCIGAARLLSE